MTAAGMRVNLGCGQAYLEGWVNVDEMPDVRADIYASAFDFVRDHGHDVAELYMGHFLEHLMPGDARALLTLLADRLPAGATVSAVTPDIRAIFDAYEEGEIDNRTLNEAFIYSYVQPSHHVWCYDATSLVELFESVGFVDVAPIDPLTWPPVFHKEGPESMWQCGVRATVPEARREGVNDEEERSSYPEEIDLVEEADLPATTEAMLLTKVERLRAELRKERARAQAAVTTAEAESKEAERLRGRLEAAEHDLRELRASRTYQLATRLRKLSETVLPKGTQSRKAAALAVLAARETRAVARRLREEWQATSPMDDERPVTYGEWCAEHDASETALARQFDVAQRARRPLRVLVVIDAARTPEAANATLASLESQSWPYWEAAVLRPPTPHDTAPDTGAQIREYPTQPHGRLFNMSATTNASSADFVLFVDAGTVLAPDCLYHVAVVATQDPLVDLVFWDDDVIDENGRRKDPRFRSSWSPESLLGADILGQSFAFRRRRFQALGGLRTELGTAALWDLLLRSRLGEERVARVPRVLSHVRARPRNASPDGVRAVTDALAERELPARAKATTLGEVVRVEWDLERWPRVSVVVPTRHNRDHLSGLLPGLVATDYDDFELIVVDNGGRTTENEAWYAEHTGGLDARIEWWDAPFNYAAVNNLGVARSTGEVVVFLNDDIEVLDRSWLREIVGWAMQPELGAVGAHLLDPDGRIQFAGTIVGLNGFAEHLFAGMSPGSDSLLGPTTWYRNVLAVTGACLAVRRQVFDAVGGFDERFPLCGNDVALGLDLRLLGLRNLCTPFAVLRHLESATRGTHIPEDDFFTSYWRYQSWLFGGDPYFSPNLSLTSRIPALRTSRDKTVGELISGPLGRSFEVFRQRNDASEAAAYADSCRASKEDVRAIRALHAANSAPLEPETVNWFIPDLDSPFYGGINTAFRIADHLARNHGVTNRFVVWGRGPERYVRSGIAAAFPALGSSPIVFHDGSMRASLEDVPPADVSIATLWVTAYQLAHFPHTRRKFYLIQDFEPVFHPAGTLYALAEESYRLGLYGLCNTEVMQRIYADEYGGRGRSFVPAVDQSIFHGDGRTVRLPDEPVTVFVYARAGHWRNCWELAGLALKELKDRVGDRVRIVAAGSWATPEGDDLDPVVKHLGLLDYRATGPLYRTCDVGLALTVSKHPSYLPLELMACGVPVVAFDSPAFSWLLRDGQNCLLAEKTVDGVADALERLVVNPGLRQRLSDQGLADIAANHSSWEKALAGVYSFLSDPEDSAF